MGVARVLPIERDPDDVAMELVGRALFAGGLCVVRREPPDMDRAYWLLVQPSLFGGWDLVRVWGRRGREQRRPRQLVEHFDDHDVLVGTLRRAVGRRLRRGYRLPVVQPPSKPARSRTERSTRAWRRCYGLPPADVVASGA